MDNIGYFLILSAVFFAIASPGPATLAIASTSANHGRKHGSILAFGIATGGFIWSSAAAFGLASVLYTNVWIYEVLRYFGAMYLLYLAFKSGKSALSSNNLDIQKTSKNSLKSTYFKGLLLQISNPKVILIFASVYAIFLPKNINPQELILVIISISIMANIVFQFYAYIFSTSKVRNSYMKLRRYFESIFSIFFGIAGIKLLTSNLNN